MRSLDLLEPFLGCGFISREIQMLPHLGAHPTLGALNLVYLGVHKADLCQLARINLLERFISNELNYIVRHGTPFEGVEGLNSLR
jgi:hypothetical protein